MLTDGEIAFCYKYDEKTNSYPQINRLPKYDDMLKGKCQNIKVGKLPERIPFERLEQELVEYQGYEIGSDTPKEKGRYVKSNGRLA